MEKYIVHLKQDFAIVCHFEVFTKLTEYQDPSTKELLTRLMKKYKVVISGPNTLSAYLNPYIWVSITESAKDNRNI